jgi:hypothetical protein
MGTRKSLRLFETRAVSLYTVITLHIHRYPIDNLGYNEL